MFCVTTDALNEQVVQSQTQFILSGWRLQILNLKLDFLDEHYAYLK